MNVTFAIAQMTSIACGYDNSSSYPSRWCKKRQAAKMNREDLEVSMDTVQDICHRVVSTVAKATNNGEIVALRHDFETPLGRDLI
jgi:hypothetical protein